MNLVPGQLRSPSIPEMGFLATSPVDQTVIGQVTGNDLAGITLIKARGGRDERSEMEATL